MGVYSRKRGATTTFFENALGTHLIPLLLEVALHYYVLHYIYIHLTLPSLVAMML